MGETREGPRPLVTVLALLALSVLHGLLARHVAEGREHAGHGDISHYFAVGRNLFEGRGLWLWSASTWLSEPTGLPVWGASYWMPMPALVAALGMALVGEATFSAAGEGVLLLTAIAPVVTYLVTRAAFDDRRLALGAAVLATGFHLFLDMGTVVHTHGPMLVFGGLALWAVTASVRQPRLLFAAGVLAAAAQATRSDGAFWLVALVAAHLANGSGARGLRRLWPAALGYVLALTPLLVLNLRATGSPWPGSLLQVALLPSYPALYSLPETLTVERWLAPGWAGLLGQKLDVAGTNAATFAFGMTTIGGPGAAAKLATYAPHVLTGLALLGATALLRKRLAGFWVYLACTWLLYSGLFTHTGHTSFESVMFALLPLQLGLAARGLWLLLGGAGTPVLAGSNLRRGLYVATLLALGAAGVVDARASSLRRIEGNRRLFELNRALAARFVQRHELRREVVMVSPTVVHSFHAHTRVPTVSIPYFASAEAIWRAGRRVGATYALVKQPPRTPRGWNAPDLIAKSPLFEVVDEAVVREEPRRLYRLVERAP